MSSGQWEVVGKNKKSQNGKLKSKEDEKKALKNGPKLEDVGEWELLPTLIMFFSITYNDNHSKEPRYIRSSSFSN